MTNKIVQLRVVDGKAWVTPCPMCSKPAIMPHSPFCSHRCAQLDLGKWLSGEYDIMAHEATEEGDLEALLAAADKDSDASDR